MNATLIGYGFMKLVYGMETRPDLAFYIPRQIPVLTYCLFEPELRAEVEKTRQIKQAVTLANRSTDHLAIDLTPSSTAINGQYTVQTPRASGDMEQEIRKKDLSFTERLNLCLNCLEGFSALHAAGWFHRDPKPENILIYKKEGLITAKISDWGKAEKQQTPDPQETIPYKGNNRFAPPEFRSSFKSETYTLGIILLRVLEESILSQSTDKDMLIEPLNKRRFIFEKTDRGFIKYIFSNRDSFYAGPKWFRRLVAWWNNDKIYQSTASKEKNQELAYLYIDELFKRIITHKFCSQKVAKEVTTLIKEMIHFNPHQRPSSQQAYETLQTIVEGYQQENTPSPITKAAFLVESIWISLNNRFSSLFFSTS